MAGDNKDERFAHILSDPKLQQIKLKEQKTKVDKRFQSLIAGSKSKQKCLIDKRGRPVTALSKGGLRRFYDLSDSEEEEEKTQRANHLKDKKEKDIFEKTDKKGKEKTAEKVKDEKKERTILKTKSDGEEDDDDEQTDEEEEIELDVAEKEEDEDESDEEESAEEDEDEEEEEEEEDDNDDDTESSDDDEEEDEDDKSNSQRHKKKKGDINPDYSRGIGNISSSSDEEEDDEDQDSGEDKASHTKGPVATIHPWAELIEKEVPVVEQSTQRLAVCNMNWDYVTAQDLMMLCNSFKPQHGSVFSVTIYPSEFGIERMREEYKKGPKEITDVKQSTAKSTTQTTTKAGTKEIEDTNPGSSKEKAKKITKEKQSTEKKDDKSSESVRMYELNRLRYFFAVVECDSVETADQIYTNCDGMEFEKSGTKLDFRYIPDDETFDYEPKSVATSLPASGTYKPPHFVDAAVSRTDVKLSWDRTSHQRLAVTQMDFRKVKNIDELEDQFQEYIAPYTSEDEEDGEDPYPDLDWSYIPGELPAKKDVQDMKSALLKEEEKAEDGDEDEADEEEQKSDDDQVHMEFSWDIGLKDSLEGAAKQKKKETENAKLTPWEQYQKTKKDKKRQKEREKKRKGKTGEKKESEDKIKETSVELDSFFLPDGSSDEEKETPKRQKESLKKRAKRRKREAEEQRLEVDQSVLADPRFADLAKKDFALDPSAPEFRKRRRKF